MHHLDPSVIISGSGWISGSGKVSILVHMRNGTVSQAQRLIRNNKVIIQYPHDLKGEGNGREQQSC